MVRADGGFWYKLKNFGKKIVGGVKKAAKVVAPVAGIAAPLLSKIPVIGPAMGIGAKAISTIGKVIP